MLDARNVKGVFEAGAGEWVMILSLVFGGCCSNVWALEAVLKHHPKSGTFLTFAQFAYITIQNVSSHVVFPAKGQWRWIPRLRRSTVPMKRWMVQVVFFLAVSLMNNYAFGLKIPITVHIIFRSGGLCVSMLTGYFIAGKRYSFGQTLAGLLITVGIVVATISAPRRPVQPSEPTLHTQSSSPEWLSDGVQYIAGVGLLSIALFLSACLGLWQEETYRLYGNRWKEALFYSHFLSLPFFVPLYPSLSATFASYTASPPMTLLLLPSPSASALFSLGNAGHAVESRIVKWKEVLVPSAIFALAVNVATQGVCIRGVNRLTSRVSSTTVNLVLTVRKAVSLAISVWFNGSRVTPGLMVGGTMVLVGTVVYSLAPTITPKGTEADSGVPADVEPSEEVANSTALRDRNDFSRRRSAKA